MLSPFTSATFISGKPLCPRLKLNFSLTFFCDNGSAPKSKFSSIAKIKKSCRIPPDISAPIILVKLISKDDTNTSRTPSFSRSISFMSFDKVFFDAIRVSGISLISERVRLTTSKIKLVVVCAFKNARTFGMADNEIWNVIAIDISYVTERFMG